MKVISIELTLAGQFSAAFYIVLSNTKLALSTIGRRKHSRKPDISVKKGGKHQ